MTVSTQAVRAAYACDGSTTEFAVPFQFFGLDELRVIARDADGVSTVLTRGTNYSVSGGSGNTGSVTLTVAPASGVTLVLQRSTTRTQTTSYVEGGPLSAASLVNALDRAIGHVQELWEAVERTVRVPSGETPISTLPLVSSRKNQFFVFDGDGVPGVTELVDTGARAGKLLGFDAAGSAQAMSVVPSGNILVSAAMEGVLAAATLEAAMTELGISAAMQPVVGSASLIAALGQLALDSEVDVLLFGAKCDGVTDDTAAWQSAATWLSSHGGALTWRGASVVSGLIEFTGSNIALRGKGRGASILKPVNGSVGTLKFSGSWVSASDFLVDGSAAGTWTAGTTMEFGGAGNIFLNNISGYKGYDGIVFTEGAGTGGQIHLGKIDVNDVANNGVHFPSTLGGAMRLTDMNIGTTQTLCAAGTGLTIQGGSTINLSGVNVAGFFDDIVINAVQDISDLVAVNVAADGVTDVLRTTGGDAWRFGHVDGKTLRRVSLVQCWGGSMPVNGFNFLGYEYGIELINCRAVNNGQNGLYASGNTADLKVVGGVYSGNSRISSGEYCGLYIANGCSHFTIEGATARVVDGFSNTQQAGIYVQGTSHDYYVINGNDTSSNITWGIHDEGTGTNKYITNNL